MEKVLFALCFVFAFMLNAQDNISLISPNDGDSIKTKNPLLTWSYLGGLQQNNERTFYRLIIVELKDNQSAESGIIVNQPLVKMDKIQGTQLFYPYDAPEINEGVWYGWQIQKISNNVIIDKSEAWRFILPLEVQTKQYYKMKIKNDGIDYVAEEGKLRFEFIEQYKDDELKYYLYNAKNELMDVKITMGDEEMEEDKSIKIKRTGNNYYEIDLGQFALEGSYKLVVIDKKKQRFEMKYTVK
ncbi:MAG: hypothetical protein EP305_04480 [Bacteroidetes bacterium]|nr:MAG: hypothetical protein EP305_04480 [Bacteroidota bacterium]